jgi:hypothetical protein
MADAEIEQAAAGLAQAARKWRLEDGPAPVHDWNPTVFREIGLRIDAEGRWFHEGGLINRPRMVKLFAALLRKDPQGYVLVTPAEKVAVEVEDAPFVVRDMRVEAGPQGQVFVLRTNLDEEVAVGPGHPLRFEAAGGEGIKPYVRVRADLWARVSRALAVALVEAAETRVVEGRALLGVASGGGFFPIAPAEGLEDAS